MEDNLSCPECNNEMKHGYIFSPRRICWSESPDSIFADFGSEEILIKDALFKVGKIPASRCKNCKLVIFKHN